MRGTSAIPRSIPVSKWIIATTLILSIKPTYAVDVDTLAQIKNSGEIILAHREKSIPFSYLQDGRPVGFSVDLCLRITSALQRALSMPKLSIRWIQVSSAERITAIRERKADIECGNTTNTPERRAEVDFAMPHFYDGIKILGKLPQSFESLHDLRAKSVIVVQNSTSEKHLRAHERTFHSAGVRVMIAKHNEEAFNSIRSGLADAWLSDGTILHALRAAASDGDNYSVSSRQLSVEPLALMVRKSDTKLKELINSELSALMVSGEFSKLYGQWFLKPIPALRAPLRLKQGEILRSHVLMPSPLPPMHY